MDERRVAPRWRLPDELWERLEPLLPNAVGEPQGWATVGSEPCQVPLIRKMH